MTDEIKLPPLPPPADGQVKILPMYTVAEVERIRQEAANYAVEQDRARREKQEPHRALLALQKDGYVDINSDDDHAQHLIVLHWTPERAWIESGRNRALAQRLRNHYYDSALALDVADALDGGER